MLWRVKWWVTGQVALFIEEEIEDRADAVIMPVVSWLFGATGVLATVNIIDKAPLLALITGLFAAFIVTLSAIATAGGAVFLWHRGLIASAEERVEVME